MACTDRIDTHLLHDLQLAFDGPFIDSCSQAAQIMMQANTEHFGRLPVQIKAGRFIPAESTDTKGRFIPVGQLTTGSYFGYCRI